MLVFVKLAFHISSLFFWKNNGARVLIRYFLNTDFNDG